MLHKKSLWLLAVTLLATSPLQALDMRGCIKTEGPASEKVPQFRVLFAGKETMTDTEGLFSLPLEERFHRYSLLICKNVKQNFIKTNTVRNVSMMPEDAYRYYEFERAPHGLTWRQQEKRLDPARPIAPEECVIMLMDATHVARVEPWRLEFGPQTVKLPAIVLKPEVSNKTLAAASADSILRSLDEKPFHETVKKETKLLAQNSTVLVSLTR